MKCVMCSSAELVAKSEIESIRYKSNVLQVLMEFTVCQSCGYEFVATEQIKSNDQAVTGAKRRADGLLTPAEIRAAREALGVTQARAAELFGGGRNAFSKYERGEVAQSEAMDKLIRLCLAHPYFMEELDSSVRRSGGQSNIVYMKGWRASGFIKKEEPAHMKLKYSVSLDDMSYCYEA